MYRIRALTVCAAMICSPAAGLAGDKEDIATAARSWADAMTSHDAERVMKLYDPEAVLWGTRSPSLRKDPAKVREYFGILQTVPPSYKATLGEQNIRVYGDMAINTGTYTFSEVREGKEILRPARFSFVYRKNPAGQWLVVDHHSSAVPEAPK